MPRLKGVSDRDAGLGAKIAFFFTKRKLAQMTGLETAAMLEPLRMYAHIPRLLSAIGKLEQAESKLEILSPRHRALACADGVVRSEAGDGLGFVPDFLMDDPEDTKQQLREAYRRLLALDFDLLLLAHGKPVVGGARDALRAFVDTAD